MHFDPTYQTENLFLSCAFVRGNEYYLLARKSRRCTRSDQNSSLKNTPGYFLPPYVQKMSVKLENKAIIHSLNLLRPLFGTVLFKVHLWTALTAKITADQDKQTSFQSPQTHQRLFSLRNHIMTCLSAVGWLVEAAAVHFLSGVPPLVQPVKTRL